jgi:tetratricopeptide (TPR) repeat protein
MTDIYSNLGLVKYKAGDRKGAIQDYSTYIRTNPNSAQAYLNRGSAKYELGDKESAYLDWKKASELGNKTASELLKKVGR